MRAHPRSRGENVDQFAATPVKMGSSPLTRGKHRPSRALRSRRRLIPAHAGKTPIPAVDTRTTEAHPRSRGENQGFVTSAVTWMGSSPLTRGKRSYWARRPRSLWAHPRSRGENEALAASDATDKGSSPLTRGKPRGAGLGCAGPGLIPAHAGKTPEWTLVFLGLRAHPRSRGENSPHTSVRVTWPGSSPLTRGKHKPLGRVLKALGLIPAHAGKTRRHQTDGILDTAHPRSRGENRPMTTQTDLPEGSSPLTRGKPVWDGIKTGAERLIPAHAGKTAPGRRDGRGPGAHPRSRGENAHGRGGPASGSGLIPAHAGKTTWAAWCCTEDGAHPRSRGENAD